MPALAPAPALTPAAAVPAAAAALAAPRAAAAVQSVPAASVAAPGSERPHQTLLQSVSAPMADTSRLSGADSAAAAESDFAARAQLGGGASAAGAVPSFAAAFAPEAAPHGSGLLKATVRAAARPAQDTVKLSGGVDATGARMREALKTLASSPAGTTLDLDFSPAPESLQALTDGVLLYRSRADGRWHVAAAGADGFSAPSGDFDAAFLGRSAAPAPSAADLRASEGRSARFAVVGPRGVVEWNSDMPAGAADFLDGTAGRILSRVAGAVGAYPRLLAARGVTAEARDWAGVPADYIEEGSSPAAERQLAGAIIPGWMREELPVTAGKIGRAHPPEYVESVLARSKVWVYTWHSRWSYEISGGLPDGHYDPKFGIRVMLKTDWRKLKDPESHFKVLFAHEYTHWLQNEGLVTRRYGGETPAVAVELLRAVELVGVDGMRAGRVGIIHEGTLKAFDEGRQWAHGEMKETSSLYYRGLLGGVAYEVGVIAGRPEAAWEFLNLVMAEKGALTPREAFERVTGVKK
jgi:hypothetical protein